MSGDVQLEQMRGMVKTQQYKLGHIEIESILIYPIVVQKKALRVTAKSVDLDYKQ
jgi:hypothetical protein